VREAAVRDVYSSIFASLCSHPVQLASSKDLLLMICRDYPQIDFDRLAVSGMSCQGRRTRSIPVRKLHLPDTNGEESVNVPRLMLLQIARLAVFRELV